MNKKTSTILTIAVLIGIVIAIFAFNLIKKNGYKTYNVKTSDFVRTVEVSGKIVPKEEIDLSFEITGKVSVLNVRVGDMVKSGDILARLNSAEINSQIEEARANLESAEAKFSEVSGSGVDNSKILNAKNTLLNRLKKSYILSDDVIKNSVDLFFTDPNSRFPSFNTALSSFFLRKEIEDARYEIGQMLLEWKDYNSGITENNVSSSDAQKFINNLKRIESLLAIISDKSSEFRENTNTTKQQIDAYLASISQSRTSVSTIIIDINASVEALRSVEAEAPVLLASVNAARASYDRLIAKSENYVMRAPFDGVITKRNYELGVVVNPGQSVFSMVSNQPLEIESFVPEINIAGINIGNRALVKLDAFGPDKIFNAKISHIDPRETIKDGVTTYRILLSFTENYPNILSGMSAEIEIEKENILNQIVIPRYLIKSENGQNFVSILQNKKANKIPVEIGDRDTKGNVLIISGVSVGDNLIISQ